MADTTTAGKVHYLSDATGKLFFCSGPGGAVSYSLGTRVLDEVTCRICRRKLVQKAMSSPGAEFGIA